MINEIGTETVIVKMGRKGLSDEKTTVINGHGRGIDRDGI